MPKIYYLGFYGDAVAYQENRNIVPGGVNKMDYVAFAMKEAGFDVTIVSPSWVSYKKSIGLKFFKRRTFEINEKVKVVLPPSVALPFKFTKPIIRTITKIWLTAFLLLKIRRNEKVVVYHSLFYINILYWLKKFIKFNLILEVEEVYSIVFQASQKWRQKELRLIQVADSFIFPNDLMRENLRLTDKKQIVVYGTYRVDDRFNDNNEYFHDGKIHLVYAGVIDTMKNAAFNVIKASAYLPENYVIHILGFGQEQDVAQLKNTIEICNAASQCKVIFEGVKTGDDYLQFISACQIGLNPQENEGEYVKFIFPSKVLSYLSLGLNVVTARLDCLAKSEIDSLLCYYDDNSGKSIAGAILSISDFNGKNIKSKLAELNQSFISKLRYL